MIFLILIIKTCIFLILESYNIDFLIINKVILNCIEF